MPATEYPPQPPAEDLLDAFLSLSTPEGFRAELIEGEIVLTPPPDGNHETIISRVIRQIMRRVDLELDFSANKGLVTPAGRFIPDVTFGPAGVFADRDPWMEPEGVLLVVEVTSGNPARDRQAKRTGYAAAQIPLYLLVDRHQHTVVLHSDPDLGTGDYLTVHNAPYGKDVPLPRPFDLALETVSFA